MAEPLLALEGVDASYGAGHVLEDVSLSVEAGSTVALVGRNGAGKTTTVRTIAGVLEPRNGRVVYDGSSLDGVSIDERRRRGIAWVPEGRRIFPEHTVEENLRIAAYAGEVPVEAAYERFPRLRERRGQLARTLSGGERQMLAIGRALVGPRPRLLLLDEPCEGLAPKIAETVYGIVEELRAEGVTILLVDQNATRALELADAAYVIQTGRIEHAGPADELLADAERLERFVGIS